MRREAAATLVFTGRLVPESFRAFAAHRARLLGLALAVTEAGPARAVVAVSGQADFVDAFEMALSLGPIDCLVLDVMREENAVSGKGSE